MTASHLVTIDARADGEIAIAARAPLAQPLPDPAKPTESAPRLRRTAADHLFELDARVRRVATPDVRTPASLVLQAALLAAPDTIAGAIRSLDEPGTRDSRGDACDPRPRAERAVSRATRAADRYGWRRFVNRTFVRGVPPSSYSQPPT